MTALTAASHPEGLYEVTVENDPQPAYCDFCGASESSMILVSGEITPMMLCGTCAERLRQDLRTATALLGRR